MSIENISDTARWVAVYRAMETERPDAIFRDPFARRLAGDHGERIVRQLRSGRAMAWAMIVRTAVFDEIIRASVSLRGVERIVNLAAGLDARPWRLELPPSLRWVDVDLPGILQYKTDCLQSERTTCQYEAVHTDLTSAEARRALFERLSSENLKTLVVTEGLVIYLTPEQAGDLAQALHQQPSFLWWLIDLASPRLLTMMNQYWGQALKNGNAPFRFAPENSTEFFESFGWREREYRSSTEEARRLNREMRGMWFWRWMSQFAREKRREQIRRMSGFVLLERI